MVSPTRALLPPAPLRGKTEAAPFASPGTAVALESAIVCARCSSAVTKESARTTRLGAHVHTRVNPHGYVFEFGCFAEAEGARTEGAPTEEHTWFPGHAWRVALCGSCGAHLGWRFEGASGTFFGLVLDRLVSS